MEYIRINPGNPEDKIITYAVAILKAGGVIVFPTETVYGIAGNLFSPQAVHRIYTLKKRSWSNPLPVFVASLRELGSHAKELPSSLQVLAQKFWPGPLTVILSKKEEIHLPFPCKTLGFRIPNHPVPLTILSDISPLACTSANISGKPPALTAEEAKNYFQDNVDLILDAGPLSANIPSTVLDLSGEEPTIIREGKIKMEALENFLHCKIYNIHHETTPARNRSQR